MGSPGVSSQRGCDVTLRFLFLLDSMEVKRVHLMMLLLFLDEVTSVVFRSVAIRVANSSLVNS